MRIREIAKFLGLKYPVKVILSPKKNKEADAYYWPMERKEKLSHHLIKLYIGNKQWVRDIETLIAHELCHAKDQEKDNKGIHGKSFKRYAKKVSKEFDLPNIYLKDVDTP